MNSIEKPLQKAEKAIAEAEYIVIGAGAGLSTAAGIHYSGPDFQEAFKDMIERYGFTDLYTSSFYPFQSEEEKWAYWSRHIDYARFAPEGLPLYKRLLEMVQGKEYFVITTNVDGQFIKAGFPEEKVFEVQGDYGLMQCATACHPKRYSNERLVKQMVARQHDCRIPSELVPVCPSAAGRWISMSGKTDTSWKTGAGTPEPMTITASWRKHRTINSFCWNTASASIPQPSSVSPSSGWPHLSLIPFLSESIQSSAIPSIRWETSI